MGALGSKKPVIQTVTLSQPVSKPKGEVTVYRQGKQTIQGNIINSNTLPLCLKKLQTWAWENAVHHHTKKFVLPKTGTLVVRRGQPFKITLTFNRPYNSLIDEVKFFFETGDKPLPGNDTMVCLSSYTSQGSSGWKSDFLPIIGTKNRDCIQAHLWVFTPPDCIVSDWRFFMQTILRTETETATVNYEHPDRIYILFNPWCKNDTVYYPAQPLLDEYILNSSGIMFQGCRKRMTVKPWVYGQFEAGVLEACIYLIKRGFNFRCGPAMGDPTLVVRKICSVLNAENDDGVLKGKWSTNDFADGRSPTMWSGSVAILKQFVENALAKKGDNPEPVKYGQCFVYAGLVTTICRAIGIPCRCVTNYNSGRGTDGGINLDVYYELLEDGTIAEMTGNDNEHVWNFHVWNDVWMRRPDLDSPYNEPDWQALDPTLQLSSAHGFQSCGPASLPAIKNGLMDFKYDVSYLFAEVNAEVSHWLKLEMGDWTVFKVEGSRVGRSISTKTPNGKPAVLTYKFNAAEMGRIRQDITGDYKYKKGTKTQEAVMEKVKENRRERPMYRCKAKDVLFKLEEKEYEYIGDDFYVKASVTNNSDEARTVKVVLLCETIHYNGKRHLVVKQQTYEKTIEPMETENLQMGVYEDDYVTKLAEHTCMKQYGFLRVEETGQVEAWMDDFLLQKPHLNLEVSESVFKDHNFELKMSFKNPLHRPLTNCTVSIEGAGLESMLFIRNFEKVSAQSEWTGILNLMPVRSKSLEISATFHCKEMFDIIGFTTVKVEKGEPPVEEEDATKSSVPEVSETGTT